MFAKIASIGLTAGGLMVALASPTFAQYAPPYATTYDESPTGSIYYPGYYNHGPAYYSNRYTGNDGGTFEADAPRGPGDVGAGGPPAGGSEGLGSGGP
jgi:hypothetical protein